MLNFAIGSVIVLATLLKYLWTRRLFSKSFLYGSYATSEYGSPSLKPAMRDRWLILRFSFAFLILTYAL
jgi:hypothetical protein